MRQLQIKDNSGIIYNKTLWHNCIHIFLLMQETTSTNAAAVEVTTAQAMHSHPRPCRCISGDRKMNLQSYLWRAGATTTMWFLHLQYPLPCWMWQLLRPVHNIRMGERCDRKCIQIDLDARCNVHVRWNRNQFYSSVRDTRLNHFVCTSGCNATLAQAYIVNRPLYFPIVLLYVKASA